MDLSTFLITNTLAFACRGLAFNAEWTSQTQPINKVTTCLENLEMSVNLTAVRQMSGKKSYQEIDQKSGGKSYPGNCLILT